MRFDYSSSDGNKSPQRLIELRSAVGERSFPCGASFLPSHLITTTKMTTPVNPLLTTLLSIHTHDLRILHLSESITAAFPPDATRSSDVSDSLSTATPTPAALQADLSHYKELFSKLRFSYLEQVTKEKFLRAITEDAPLVVEAGENEELEAKLVIAKEELRRSKREVEGILAELEGLSRRLADGLLPLLSYIFFCFVLRLANEDGRS